MKGRIEEYFRKATRRVLIVKLITNDDGDEIQHPKWCLSVDIDGCNRTLCTGEAFGFGESRAKYKDSLECDGKKITCEKCINFIEMIKDIEL